MFFPVLVVLLSLLGSAMALAWLDGSGKDRVLVLLFPISLLNFAFSFFWLRKYSLKTALFGAFVGILSATFIVSMIDFIYPIPTGNTGLEGLGWGLTIAYPVFMIISVLLMCLSVAIFSNQSKEK